MLPPDPSWDPKYLAGFFDGDGTVGIRRYRIKGHQRFYYKLDVGLANNDRRLLDLVKEHFGGSVVGKLVAHKDGHKRKPQFKWQACNQIAEAFLRYIAPFVFIRRAAVELGMAFRKHVGKHGLVEQERMYNEYVTLMAA